MLYHPDAVYLLDRFGMPLLGTIEATADVPPSNGEAGPAVCTTAELGT